MFSTVLFLLHTLKNNIYKDAIFCVMKPTALRRPSFFHKLPFKVKYATYSLLYLSITLDLFRRSSRTLGTP